MLSNMLTLATVEVYLQKQYTECIILEFDVKQVHKVRILILFLKCQTCGSIKERIGFWFYF
jgi:hypothetical protein